ncbi:hypothetical protein [Caulobacter sp. UNC358MFTsu5.1]|uniref:hypothetical protein n=1 Tax=Caulobacter sp. UNC358MFTsu5.1 TaxID=1449049 RepID=UPI0004A76C9F|nr:hypothetical protein [Caulobacter sp. UNC358MFTsu5.1]
MDASDLLLHRTALIGAAVALAIGLTGGLALKVGAQTAPESDMAFASEPSASQDEPIAWPSGKVPDYVVGTDFLRPQRPDTPVVVASYEVPEYVPAAWTEPTPQAQPVRLAEAGERRWPSTGGDILDTRLPEDAPSPPEPPPAIDAPDAPDAPQAAAPITMAAAN